MDTTLGVLLTQQCACGTIYARLHPRLCGIAYPLSDMEPSHCVAANALLPLSVVGSAMLQPRHPRPLFLFLFFFFCLIEIQLGTQTMPVSWHILERGEYDNNIRLLPHIRPSTDHHGPMPTCNWVFFLTFST